MRLINKYQMIYQVPYYFIIFYRKNDVLNSKDINHLEIILIYPFDILCQLI